jgi:hypothetical protein
MRYGNLFPGPFQNLAHHAVDFVSLFQRTTTSCQTNWQRQQSRWDGTG